MPDIKILGYKEAVQVFVQLAEQMQKRIVRQVLRKSARPMVMAARNRAPKRTGRLRKSIRIVSLKKDRVPTVVPMAIAPVFDVSKNGKVNAFYARFVHDGTKDRYPRAVTRKRTEGARVLVFSSSHGEKVFTRSARGVSPNPFMMQAFNNATGSTVDDFGKEMATAVENFANKNFVKL